MAPYHHIRKDELAVFAANRKLQVPSTAKASKKPTRQDYIRALKEADNSRTFRFLDLPPELRNNVYKELLVLQNSFTVYPQVLATCKLVHNEASSILYGDNLIEIKIFRDGIFTHGTLCGDHEFEYNYGQQGGGTKKGNKIEWPQFLRKAQFVRLSVERYRLPFFRGQLLPPRLGALYFVLYSLCSFLTGSHKLRSLVIDLNELRPLFQLGGVLQEFEESIGLALYPLRLLGPIKDHRVQGTSTALDQILTPRNNTLKMADKVLSGSAWDLMKNSRLAWSIYTSIIGGGEVRNLGNWIASIIAFVRFLFESSDASKGLWQSLLSEMEIVRVTWDRVPTELLTDQCKKQIDELMRLEVEVQLALRRGIQALNVEMSESTDC